MRPPTKAGSALVAFTIDHEMERPGISEREWSYTRPALITPHSGAVGEAEGPSVVGEAEGPGVVGDAEGEAVVGDDVVGDSVGALVTPATVGAEVVGEVVGA